MSSSVLVVTVGTDHHRFDRLMTWVEHWLDASADVRCIVQQGASRLPAGATGLGIVSRPHLLEVIRTADVVVTQGGPGSIFDARECGMLPIVVPRLAALDEVVDDHQVAFSRRMAQHGWALVAEDEQAFRGLLDKAFADPSSVRRPPETSDTSATVAAVAAAADAVMAARPGFVDLHRGLQLLRRRRQGSLR